MITGNEPVNPITVGAHIYSDGSSEPPYVKATGLTIRQHTCIQLELPETGVDWLDELIAKKRRQSISAKAMLGLLANKEYSDNTSATELSKAAMEYSDTLITELNK